MKTPELPLHGVSRLFTEAAGRLPAQLAFGILALTVVSAVAALSQGGLPLSVVLLVGFVVVVCLVVFERSARRTWRNSLGPLSSRRFEDRILDAVARNLGELHYMDASYMRTTLLMPQLLRLFSRNLFNEPIGRWEREQGERVERVRAAIQTLQVLRAYDENVRLLAVSRVRSTYRNLLEALEFYCAKLVERVFPGAPSLSHLELWVEDSTEFTRLLGAGARGMGAETEEGLDSLADCEAWRQRVLLLREALRVEELKCRLELTAAAVKDLKDELSEARASRASRSEAPLPRREAARGPVVAWSVPTEASRGPGAGDTSREDGVQAARH